MLKCPHESSWSTTFNTLIHSSDSLQLTPIGLQYTLIGAGHSMQIYSPSFKFVLDQLLCPLKLTFRQYPAIDTNYIISLSILCLKRSHYCCIDVYTFRAVWLLHSLTLDGKLCLRDDQNGAFV